MKLEQFHLDQRIQSVWCGLMNVMILSHDRLAWQCNTALWAFAETPSSATHFGLVCALWYVLDL